MGSKKLDSGITGRGLWIISFVSVPMGMWTRIDRNRIIAVFLSVFFPIRIGEILLIPRISLVQIESDISLVYQEFANENY